MGEGTEKSHPVASYAVGTRIPGIWGGVEGWPSSQTPYKCGETQKVAEAGRPLIQALSTGLMSAFSHKGELPS